MALRDQWKDSQMTTLRLFAELQATLHNAHFTRDDKKHWTPEMFMPGYKHEAKPVQSWQMQKAMAQALTNHQITDKDRDDMARDARAMEDRVVRAKEAQAAGHTPEFVRGIMEGVNG